MGDGLDRPTSATADRDGVGGPPAGDDPLDPRTLVRRRTAVLLAHRRSVPGTADRWLAAIAERRRAWLDDAGYPVCPACGARTRADGCRTCPACEARRPRAA
jgi:hypothetical protein